MDDYTSETLPGKGTDSVRNFATRLHPFALWSLILALLGIPLMGLITGVIAVVLAGIAITQIVANPYLHGRKLAIAGLAIGLADVVLWVFLLGFALPRSVHTAYKSVEQFTFPSANFLERAPENIRKAMELNVFFVVERRGWPAFLHNESLTGSGIILGQNEGEYVILTNRHVVDPAFNGDQTSKLDQRAFITVYFHDGTHKKGYVWWTAPEGLDLALVATGPNPHGIPFPELPSASDFEIGDRVFTVGNPHELSWSYADGAISGIRESSKGSIQLKIIQTQTPINQGNSGGGLYLEDGTLIGIVSWTKDKSQAEGISFAITYEDFLAVYNREKVE